MAIQPPGPPLLLLLPFPSLLFFFGGRPLHRRHSASCEEVMPSEIELFSSLLFLGGCGGVDVDIVTCTVRDAANSGGGDRPVHFHNKIHFLRAVSQEVSSATAPALRSSGTSANSTGRWFCVKLRRGRAIQSASTDALELQFFPPTEWSTMHR